MSKMKSQPKLNVYLKKSKGTIYVPSDSESICSIESPLMKANLSASPMKESSKPFILKIDDSLLPLKLNLDEEYELRPKVKNPVFQKKKSKKYPIPKGKTPYCLAKKAEYVERDLEKAEKFYRQAVEEGERLESSIKDLATVIHQLGRTQESIDFLNLHRSKYEGDLQKYDNLIGNLSRQVVPSGNCFTRALALVGISDNFNEQDVRDLFINSSRILSIKFKDNVRFSSDVLSDDDLIMRGIEETRICVIEFTSFSAARKTFETTYNPKTTPLYWMDIEGYIVEKAELHKIGPGKRPASSTSQSCKNLDSETDLEGSRSTLPSSLTDLITPTKVIHKQIRSQHTSIIFEESSPSRKESRDIESPRSFNSLPGPKVNSCTSLEGGRSERPHSSNNLSSFAPPNVNSFQSVGNNGSMGSNTAPYTSNTLSNFAPQKESGFAHYSQRATATMDSRNSIENSAVNTNGHNTNPNSCNNLDNYEKTITENKQLAKLLDQLANFKIPKVGECWDSCLYIPTDIQNFTNELEYTNKDVLKSCLSFYDDDSSSPTSQTSTTQRLIKSREDVYSQQIEQGGSLLPQDIPRE